jgi:hypothetical protein
MDNAELVLRFVALADRLTAYKPPLRQFLNEYMREYRENAGHIDALILAFERAAETTEALFADKAYRRSNRTGSAGRTVNKALFDTVMLSLHFAAKTRYAQGEMKSSMHSSGCWKTKPSTP